MPSAEFHSTVNAQETESILLYLVVIRHPSLSEPIRLCNDSQDVVSGGKTYIGFPFDLTLFQENESTPRASIRIQNVDRRIGDAVLGLTTRPTMDIAVVLADAPDDFEFDWLRVELASVNGNSMAVSGEIVGIDFTQEPWPSRRATEDILPGLHLR